MNKKMIILIRIIPLISILLFSSSSKTKKKVITPFPVDSLILYMKEVGIKHIGVVLQQIKLETGHLTFYNAETLKACNNITAMRKSKNRKTTCIGVLRGYAKYENWRSGLEDYYYWQNQFGPIKTNMDYYKYLQRRRYSLYKTYIKVLKQVPLTKKEIELIKK